MQHQPAPESNQSDSATHSTLIYPELHSQVFRYRAFPHGVRRTQFTDKVHSAGVAAEGRVQADQELHVQASHLALQDVGDGLPLVLVRLPLTTGDAGAPSEHRTGIITFTQYNYSIVMISLSYVHGTSR